MTNQLKSVWHQIEWLHSAGISLIPVRDKQIGDYPAKTPYKGWKQYQSEIIPLAELWNQLEKYDTTAVAIICGAVSGKLEIIDIDVKYKPGIDAVLFLAIEAIYPELFKRIRIHGTPSGGYHLLYRVDTGTIPGNKKLAGRPRTENDPPKPININFLETRGEGGYAVAPPSLGYSVHQDVPIPLITWNERCALEAICKSHSEIIEVAPVKATKAQNDYYSTNPFEHFNGSNEAEEVLQLGGWKVLNRESSNFIWFTRPGKDTGISASFNKKKRVFYIFTSSTEFEESKGYNPASCLSILQHGGDRKKTYAYLVQKGYGVIRPEIENKIAKSKAASGKPLPPNVSQVAKQEYAAEMVHLQSTYPYGIFWEPAKNDGLIISREKLYIVAEGLGFRFYENSSVRISGNVITKQTDRDFFDGLKSYIKEEDANQYADIANCFESFIQHNGTFTISRLPYLKEDAIIKDTAKCAYKFYQNGYLFITASEFSFQTYDTLSGLIWQHDILPRQYVQGAEAGKYIDFLKLATPYTEHPDHIRKTIGYLSHQFKDETLAYITVITEACADAKDGGGSGKNVFCSLFGNTTTFKSIPGTQVRYDEKFLQSWNGERIFCISDPDKKFDFSFLKESSSGPGLLKKLFKDEVTVPVEKMPKFVIPTNFSFEVKDGGLRRRIIYIEFSDFFTKCGGVDVHFGCHFPKGWDLTDWIGYDNFIAGCVKDWLAGGLKLTNPALTEGGWHKQFEQTWGQIITGIIDDTLERWIEREWISNDNFRADIDAYFRENNTAISYRPSMSRIYGGILEWCKHFEYEFENNLQHRNEIGISTKHKWFGKKGSTPF